MKALWSNRKDSSHIVSRKFKRIRCFSDSRLWREILSAELGPHGPWHSPKNAFFQGCGEKSSQQKQVPAHGIFTFSHLCATPSQICSQLTVFLREKAAHLTASGQCLTHYVHASTSSSIMPTSQMRNRKHNPCTKENVMWASTTCKFQPERLTFQKNPRRSAGNWKPLGFAPLPPFCLRSKSFA